MYEVSRSASSKNGRRLNFVLSFILDWIHALMKYKFDNHFRLEIQ